MTVDPVGRRAMDVRNMAEEDMRRINLIGVSNFKWGVNEEIII